MSHSTEKTRVVKKSDSIAKKFVEYVLRKSSIRRKTRILNSLIVPKNVEEAAFEIFQHPFFCKISKI